MKYILTGYLIIVSFALSSQYSIDQEVCKNILFKNEENINSDQLEFSPFYYRDFVGFVFSNTKSSKDKEIDEYFFDLAFSASSLEDELTKKALFNKNINTDYHEGPSHYSELDQSLYFTRTYYDYIKDTNRDTIVNRIYRASFKDDFENPIQLGLGNESVSACHPTLTSRADIMIYAANHNRDSSKMDLYLAKGKGTKWAMERSLDEINSTSNDVFPVFIADTILCFASDRPGGIGGYDMYLSFFEKNKWSKPLLLPYPFNTTYDDLGLIFNIHEMSGYFSSNRTAGKGSDDIYSFVSNGLFWTYSPPKEDVICTITALDKLTLSAISNAEIKLSKIDLSQDRYQVDQFDIDILSAESGGDLILKLSPKSLDSINTRLLNDEGLISLPLSADTKYIVQLSAPGYETTTMMYTPTADNSDLNMILNPIPSKTETIEKPSVPDVVIPSNVGEKVIFNNIYYELNSAEIQDGAADELDILAAAMIDRPTMKIELASHTDAQGTDNYNLQLSQQRAQSAKNYLVMKGIAPFRIKAIGYGESRIRNQCVNGVSCNDEEHRYNRRTEVTITSL